MRRRYLKHLEEEKKKKKQKEKEEIIQYITINIFKRNIIQQRPAALDSVNTLCSWEKHCCPHWEASTLQQLKNARHIPAFISLLTLCKVCLKYCITKCK